MPRIPPWPTTAQRTSTWWSGRATTRSTANSKSSVNWSTRRRARRSVKMTSASATWGRTAIRLRAPLTRGGLQQRQQRVSGGLERRQLAGRRFRDLRPAAERGHGAEIGANDFRISDMGPIGEPDFAAVTRPWPTTAPTTSTWWSGGRTITSRRWWTTRTRSSASGWTRRPAAQIGHERLPHQRHGAEWRRQLRRATIPPWPTTAPTTSTWWCGRATTTPHRWSTASSRSSASG